MTSHDADAQLLKDLAESLRRTLPFLKVYSDIERNARKALAAYDARPRAKVKS